MIIPNRIVINRIMRFYTGSYNQENSPALNPEGDGIGICSLDIEKGDITVYGYQPYRNPSYMCISADNKYLYAVEELPEGNGARVNSFEISSSSTLKLIDSKEISGGYACHLVICKNHLIIANYMSGNALVLEIQENGHLSSIKQKITNHGTGPNKARQESAHMHMVYKWNDEMLFLVDLTLDVAESYYFDVAQDRFVKDDKYNLKIDAGAGARHMVMSDDKSLAFVLGELTSELFVFEKRGHGFEMVQKISFLNDKKLIPSGAAIKIHPNGNFLYASERASNKIAIFRINKSLKKLAFVAYVDTEGICPRDFSIDPSGNWLIVANQDSNNLVVFCVNKEKGLLVKHSIVNVNTPVNICFQHS